MKKSCTLRLDQPLNQRDPRLAEAFLTLSQNRSTLTTSSSVTPSPTRSLSPSPATGGPLLTTMKVLKAFSSKEVLTSMDLVKTSMLFRDRGKGQVIRKEKW